MYTIYPSPGSYNDFCDRNPEIVDLFERLHHLGNELSMWRASSPDIDLRTGYTSLTIGEAKIRTDIKAAVGRGETVLRITVWPKVGDYEVPDVLLAA